MTLNVHLSLRALSYLAALEKTHHFGKAAELCFVSQPTLSAQLKKLERQLGVQLIERSPAVRLTDIGQRVVEHALRMLEDAHEIEELARNVQDPLSGELRLGLIPTVGPYLLPHVAGPLRAQFPRLRLLLVEHQTHVLVERVKTGGLDMAILALPLPGERLATRTLFAEHFQVALPEGHPLTPLERVPLGQLEGEMLLLLEDGHCLRDQALEACRLARVREAPDFRATSLETLRQMVASGIGITLLPELAARPYGIATPGLVLRRLEAPEPSRHIGAAWRSGCAREDTIARLCDAICSLMRDVTSLGSGTGPADESASS